MKKKNEVLSVILGVATACAVLIITAVLCMDFIMRTFVPELYVGGRLLNTYNRLEKERSERDEFFSVGIIPSANSEVSLKGTLNDKDFDFAGQYDKSTGSAYMKGVALSYDAEFFMQNDIAGICIPKYADVWLCAPEKNFTQALISSGFSEMTDIEIPETLPLTGDELKGTADLKGVYPVIKELLKDISIGNYSKKDDGLSEYRVYAKGSAVKKALSDMLDIFMPDNNNFLNDKAGLSSWITSTAKEGIADMEIPETVAFTVYERDKCIVYASVSIGTQDGNLSMQIDLSQKAKLLDNVEWSIKYGVGESVTGFSYKSSGNHFYRNEKLNDTSEIEIILPFLDRISVKTERSFIDAENFTFSVLAENKYLFNADISGTGSCNSDGFFASAEKFSAELGGISYVGNGSIQIRETNNPLVVPEKERYDIDSLSAADFLRLISGNSILKGALE